MKSFFWLFSMKYHMQNVLLLYTWIKYFHYPTCYEQLINIHSTRVESSSVYYDLYFFGHANHTIDRLYDQTYKNCMHTFPRRPEAWLLIDLGDIYNLNSVKIWYRKDRIPLNITTRRLEGFSVLASLNQRPDRNDICYQDPGNVTLETELEVNCSRTARLVMIYTNKSKEWDGPILEICEVEIWGCPRKRYGKECSLCDRCKGDCDIKGQCDINGCLQYGYSLPFCTDCSHGKYGGNCNKTCGRCFGNTTCNPDNGHCPVEKENKLCEPGWKHVWKCDEECDDGTFGINCRGRCKGHCAGELPCNKSNGVCTDGCADGWTGVECSRPCRFGRFGKHCMKDCGHCAGKQSCHHTNGSCLESCEQGYLGDQCLQACDDGWYGSDCKERCGYCKRNKTCHHVTGSCSGLCEPGYYGQKCEDVFSQILSNQRQMLNFMREFMSYKRRKTDLKENGTSPTDFKK